MLIIPSVVKKRKCTKYDTFLINSVTIPSHLYRHYIYYQKYCTNFIKQNNQLIFSSRYRKQRTSITIRRWRTRTCWRCRQFSCKFACCWVEWNRTLTFRSYPNYRHISSLCRTTSVYSCTIQHSAGLVSLQHHSTAAVSSQQSAVSSEMLDKTRQ